MGIQARSIWMPIGIQARTVRGTHRTVSQHASLSTDGPHDRQQRSDMTPPVRRPRGVREQMSQRSSRQTKPLNQSRHRTGMPSRKPHATTRKHGKQSYTRVPIRARNRDLHMALRHRHSDQWLQRFLRDVGIRVEEHTDDPFSPRDRRCSLPQTQGCPAVYHLSRGWVRNLSLFSTSRFC